MNSPWNIAHSMVSQAYFKHHEVNTLIISIFIIFVKNKKFQTNSWVWCCLSFFFGDPGFCGAYHIHWHCMTPASDSTIDLGLHEDCSSSKDEALHSAVVYHYFQPWIHLAQLLFFSIRYCRVLWTLCTSVCHKMTETLSPLPQLITHTDTHTHTDMHTHTQVLREPSFLQHFFFTTFTNPC